MIINIPLVTDTSHDIDSDLTVNEKKNTEFSSGFVLFANSLLIDAIDVLSILSFVFIISST